MLSEVPTIILWQEIGVTAMARLLGANGLPITPADVTSISLSVYDADLGTLIVGPTSVNPNLAIQSALVVDARWAQSGGDDVGYNFIHYVPAASFPDGERIYSIEYTLNPSAGDPFPFISTVQTKQRPSRAT